MSELLRSGATMTSEQCPVCNTPLFIVDGQLFCPRCNKPVVVVKEGEEQATVTSLSILENLENTLLGKLQESDKTIKGTKDVNDAMEQANVLNAWLEALERLKRVQKTFSSLNPDSSR